MFPKSRETGANARGIKKGKFGVSVFPRLDMESEWRSDLEQVEVLRRIPRKRKGVRKTKNLKRKVREGVLVIRTVRTPNKKKEPSVAKGAINAFGLCVPFFFVFRK